MTVPDSGVDATAVIHSAAVIADGARIGPGCRIDAYAIVGGDVTLGPDVHLKSHSIVTGLTNLGAGTEVFPFACIGEIPQDLKYQGELSQLIVGERNRIREGVTMNTGTAHGGGVTRVGDDCLFMTGAHVGHDASIGNNVILANDAAIGGHCRIDDHVIIGGLAGIHQHVRVGKGAIIGALTMVRRDVIPYGFVQGAAGRLEGINIVGLRRRGIDHDRIAELKKAYDHMVTSDSPLSESIDNLGTQALAGNSLVRDVIDFAQAGSGRNLLIPQ
ncbi:MAG: acyl-ACP--UDP-N-acetylglucosamine O-acyltransferase [Rhodobacteraceae bacterium]|nr:acyl-ACP--UDP-N-acetylglucosamine O-acyltransferase [Paracoccaceae bacterium]